MTSQHSNTDDSVEPRTSIGGHDVDEKKQATPPDVQRVDTEVVNLAGKLGEREDGLAPLDDIAFVMPKIEVMTVEEAREIIIKLLKDHEYDYNFAEAQRVKLRKLLEGVPEGQTADEWSLEIRTEAAVNKYYSPYPEVRAVTNPTDDPDMPCETIRAHLLGYLWACAAQFTNSLFNSRFPAISITSVVIQLLLYPSGMFLAAVLPDWGFNLQGKRVSLNPGPWTYKEQMLSTIIVDVGLVSAYCFWNIQTQVIYYGDKWVTPGYGILLLLSTQLMGLGFSGLMRRFVVYPTETIWPSILPTVALNRALLLPEKRETLHGWSISRYRFFWIVAGVMFFYFWFPGYIFQALSTFAWMTWISPNNFLLNTITGSQSGLGLNPWPTWDWNVMSVYAQPLAYPFFSTVQQYIGTLIGFVVIVALYFTNTRWTAHLPINSSGIFDNLGNRYNITRVLIPGTAILDEAEYKNYSPPFYSAGNLVVYGAFFAFYPFTFVFIILDMWRPILRAWRSMITSAVATVRLTLRTIKQFCACLFKGDLRGAFKALSLQDGTSIYDSFDGPFIDLLKAYPEVPDWWFLIIALVSFIFAIVIIEHWKELSTPVWTIFFVIGLNLVFLVPMSYLYAVAGTTEGLNVVTELIVGYALPGHPEALMFVKAFGYNIAGQTDNYISDQRMGYYAKLPPRAMYRGQVTSAIITSLVAYGVVQFVDTSIAGICTPDQPSGFNCENGSQVYYSSSVVWGAIGPKRTFTQLYPELQYTFLLGFLLALVWWTVKRFGSRVRQAVRASMPSGVFVPLNAFLFRPISWLKHVHPSLLFNGMLFWAPLNLTYYTTGLYVSFAFMYYVKRYKTAWWEKYNYILSAALTGGVAFSAIIIFFSVQYHPKTLSWWGNNVLAETLDGGGGSGQVALLPPTEPFGPKTWY